MNAKDISVEFERNVHELSSWLDFREFSTVLNKESFSNLYVKLIQLLYDNAKIDKIQNVVSNELIVRYGLSPSENETRKIAQDLINWWES